MLRFTIMFVVALVIATAGTARAGLLAHYDFMGDAQDHSGNNRHGTLEGAPSFVADPERGQVMSLNGTDQRVDVTASTCDLGNAFTAAMWVKIPATVEPAPLLAQPVSGWYGAGCAVIDIQGNDEWNGRVGHVGFGGNGRGNYAAGEAGVVYDDDQWHQIVVTNDGATTTHTYVDGVEVPNSNGRGMNPGNNASSLILGAGQSTDPSGYYWTSGLFSDVHLYDEVLDGNAVGALWDATQPGGDVIPEPSTLLIWALGLLALVLYGRRRRMA